MSDPSAGDNRLSFVTTTAAAHRFGELVDQVLGGVRVVLTRRGRPVAVLVRVQDLMPELRQLVVREDA